MAIMKIVFQQPVEAAAVFNFLKLIISYWGKN
jgi:hypothetical protein